MNFSIIIIYLSLLGTIYLWNLKIRFKSYYFGVTSMQFLILPNSIPIKLFD